MRFFAVRSPRFWVSGHCAKFKAVLIARLHVRLTPRLSQETQYLEIRSLNAFVATAVVRKGNGVCTRGEIWSRLLPSREWRQARIPTVSSSNRLKSLPCNQHAIMPCLPAVTSSQAPANRGRIVAETLSRAARTQEIFLKFFRNMFCVRHKCCPRGKMCRLLGNVRTRSAMLLSQIRVVLPQDKSCKRAFTLIPCPVSCVWALRKREETYHTWIRLFKTGLCLSQDQEHSPYRFLG